MKHGEEAIQFGLHAGPVAAEKPADQRGEIEHPPTESGDGNFKGETHSNETHASRTDADARLYRKSNTASELRYVGHALMDNRHRLIVNAR